jgi:hypothetical protein
MYPLFINKTIMKITNNQSFQNNVKPRVIQKNRPLDKSLIDPKIKLSGDSNDYYIMSSPKQEVYMKKKKNQEIGMILITIKKQE